MRIYLLALALSVALVSVAPAAVQPPPKAAKWGAALTHPTGSPPPASIQITKAGKVAIKASANTVTFALKLSGVTNKADDTPVTNTMNTLQIDIKVNNFFATLNFNFDITGGKAKQKFSMTNASLPNMPATGDPVEIVGGRVIESGTGRLFGVVGITLR
jgi:hypothetical protein